MSFYETYILPKFLDCVCSQEGFQNKRAQIFPHASGDVLEIGVGTGLNFEFYDFDKVLARQYAEAEKMKKLLRLPKDYILGIVPGSDTGAFELAIWNLLGKRQVDILVWESFGKYWYDW